MPTGMQVTFALPTLLLALLLGGPGTAVANTGALPRLAFGIQAPGGSLPNPEADKRRAEFYIAEGAFEEAARRLERASRYAPADPEIFRRLGYVYGVLEEPGKAVWAFKRAVDLVPEDYASWQALGEAQLADKDRAGAKESLASLKGLCGMCAQAAALEGSIGRAP